MAKRKPGNLQRQGRVFVPGQYLGDHAAGTGHRAAGFQDPTELRAQDIKPVGEGLAKEFPWMACIRNDWAAPGNTVPAGAHFRFMRGNGELGFYNYSNRPIAVDEIRIGASPTNNFTHTNQAEFWGVGKNTAVQIRTDEKEIFGQWMPTYSINTEVNRIAEYARHRGTYLLPSKYYLQRGHTFQIRVRTRFALDDGSGNYTFALSLHGYDPINDAPIKLVKEVTLAKAAGSEALVTFDENRDVPLRDAILEHVGFGLTKISDDALDEEDYPMEQLMNIELQFIPPEGPKWHTYDDWFPLGILAHQPGNWFQQLYNSGDTTLYMVDSQVVHRPITPYLVRPQGQIFVDLWSFGVESDALDTDGQTPIYPVYCAMYGRQGSLA